MPGANLVSKLTLLDGTQVEIKDSVARAAIQGGTYFLGVTTTAIADGSTTTTITISGESVNVINGNMVVYGNKEFVYAAADQKWHELGDVSGLGALALKDSASGTFTPAGSVTFTGGTVNSTGLFTPSGAITKPDVDVTTITSTIADTITEGSVTPGTAASATMPVLTAVYDSANENLSLSWTPGSFTPNTPTVVTLPMTQDVTVVTDVTAALHSTPTFHGFEDNVSVSGTADGSATFTGTPGNITVS